MDELEAARLHDADDGIGPGLLDLLDPTGLARSAGLVQFLADEGDRGGVVGGDVAEAQSFSRRSALEVVLVRLEDDGFLRAVFENSNGPLPTGLRSNSAPSCSTAFFGTMKRPKPGVSAVAWKKALESFRLKRTVRGSMTSIEAMSLKLAP